MNTAGQCFMENDIIIKNFAVLPEDAKNIRTTVFVEEQGFCEEFDDIDNISAHLVLYCNNQPAAVCRFYCESNQYFIGRLATLKQYRGNGFGAMLVAEAERLIKETGGESVMLHSQCRAMAFYEKAGYVPFGESDFDEDCPHQWMKKTLF